MTTRESAVTLKREEAAVQARSAELRKELSVADLAERLGVSVSAVSQHIAKLRAYGLVAPRRDLQTLYYRLTDHPFNQKLREHSFQLF